MRTVTQIRTNVTGGSDPVPLDQYISPFSVSLALLITGTVDANAQFTFDDVFDPDASPFTWFDHADLTNITADAQAALVAPVKAVRVLTNSGTGTVRFEVSQAGI